MPPPPVESIFAAARALPTPEARAAYLDAACGGDADLRGRVERLLAADPPAGFLDPPAEASPTLGWTPTAAPAGADHPGAVLAGRYKLVEPIGEGGMGTVWMAQQTEPVRRLVAVKLIKSGMDSKAVLARFEAERQALAMMDHPNIARVFDAGLALDGRPFFVMELVKGVPITRYCDERKLTPRQRLELFVPVCQAVQHAHQKGVIHRDIKPTNVLVALFDDRPVPKVIDFGLAKAAGGGLTEQTLVTGFGAVVGTPEYMSPEQASLNNLDIDTRSDVYALGVLLYELLTGSTPVDRKSLKEAALLEVLRIVREVEAPRPSTKLSSSAALPSIAANRGTEPARLTKLLRGELDWIVLRALEKDRARRYESAAGFAADVSRYLAGEPVQAVPPGAGYRVRKWGRRNKVAILVAVIVWAITLTQAGFSTLQWFMAADAEARAVRERQAAEHDRTVAVDAQLAADAARRDAVAAERQAAAALGRERFTAYTYRLALAHQEWAANDLTRARQLLDACPPDLRGWEWRYVRRLCDPQAVTFRGHPGGAASVAVSPDGARAASAGDDGVRVWDAATGKELFHLPGRAAAVAFAPRGERFAVAKRNAVTLHAAADGKELLVIDPNEPPPGSGLNKSAFPAGTYALAFSPDGARLATAGSSTRVGGPHGLPGGVVRVWDAATGKELPKFTASLSTAAVAVAFSPDGKHLAAAVRGAGGELPEPGEVRVWDAATGEARRTLVPHTGEKDLFRDRHALYAVAFSGDSKTLAAGGADGAVRVWDVATGKPGPVLTGHEGAVRAVAFGPAGGLLASAGADKLVRVWDAVTGKEVNALRGHTRAVAAVAYTADGGRVLSAAEVVRLWDPAAGRPAREFLTPAEVRAGVDGLAFRPDGRVLAASSIFGVQFLDLPGGRAFAESGIQPSGLSGFATVRYSPDGATVATTGAEGVKLWDAATGKMLRLFPDHPEIAQRPYTLTVDAAFSPDGTRVATVGRNLLTVWEAATGNMVHKVKMHDTLLVIGRVAYSPDGKRIATVTAPLPRVPGEARVWDAETGQQVARWPGGGAAVAFAPAGGRVAVAHPDGTVTVRDAATGAVAVTLTGHTAAVRCVAYSPDGARLATGSDDQTVRVWDAATGAEVLALRGHEGAVIAARFSPDGRYLASAGKGGAYHVRLWDAGPPGP